MDHYFRLHGACVFCGTTREKVADRLASPFCAERPDELKRRDADAAREQSANQSTGY